MTDRIAFESEVTRTGRLIKGTVVLAGSRTWRNNEWLQVDPAALVKADASDVIGRFDHDPSKILGRSSNGTVRVNRDENGIEYEIDVPDTTYGNDLLALMDRGDIRGSSFEIEGMRSSFSTDPDGKRVRTITSIERLSDVSPVTSPAFINSTAAAFSKESDVTDVIDQPAAPAPPPAPVTFAAQPKDDKSEFYRKAEAYAKDLTLDSLKEQMGNIIALGDSMSDAEQERYDAFAAVYDSRKKAERDQRDRFEKMRIADEMRRGVAAKAPATSELFASDDYTAAFSQYLRTGDKQVMAQFAQTISGSGAEGGFTVPDGFVNRLTERLKAFGGIAAVSSEITTSTGESLRWPYIDDTANKAVIAAEDVQAASGADLVFDSIELGAFEYDATGASGNPIEVSLPLLQDSAFDIEALLLRLLSTRIGRKQADHFATGAGGTEPVGLLTKTADTMTATVASLAAPEHIFQVDRAYRDNARWVMSDTTLAKLWSAQATTNEPLFQPGRTMNGKPFDVLFGYPIVIDNSAGNLVAFGDIEQGYIVRRVRGVQLLVDPYTAQKRRAVQYHAWARADGNIQDPNAYSVSTWASVTADT